MVACSLVSSRLDYANSVLFDTSAKNLARLHRIQSTLAGIIIIQRGWISISKTLSDLHWLPMKFWVDFKVATLTFKVLKSGEPGYLYLKISLLSSNASLIGQHLETFCDSIKDQDWRTSFSTLGTAGLEQSATGHLQCFIRTIVQVKIKNLITSDRPSTNGTWSTLSLWFSYTLTLHTVLVAQHK